MNEKRFSYTDEMLRELAANSRKLKSWKKYKFPVYVKLKGRKNKYPSELYICAESAKIIGSEVEFKNATYSRLEGRLSRPKNEHKWFTTVVLSFNDLEMINAVGIV